MCVRACMCACVQDFVRVFACRRVAHAGWGLNGEYSFCCRHRNGKEEQAKERGRLKPDSESGRRVVKMRRRRQLG